MIYVGCVSAACPWSLVIGRDEGTAGCGGAIARCAVGRWRCPPAEWDGENERVTTAAGVR